MIAESGGGMDKQEIIGRVLGAVTDRASSSGVRLAGSVNAHLHEMVAEAVERQFPSPDGIPPDDVRISELEDGFRRFMDVMSRAAATKDHITGFAAPVLDASDFLSARSIFCPFYPIC